MTAVLTGLDVLVKERFRRLKGQRIGVLCHQASVDSRLRHLLALMQGSGMTVKRLFAPEHGLWGTAQDQIPIADTEAISLYGDNRAPHSEQLRDLDVLVCDLQDVGSRYYTFIWTMALAMQGAAKAGIRFMVLDRPNPLGGVRLEGPVLDYAFASFVGLYATPVQHGMTIGEIALWVNGLYGVRAALEVVPMQGWKRSMRFPETGLPWVAPSPNMPTYDTAVVYPGGCLLEGTTLSEGRGTTRPFELFGAPYVQAETFAEAINAKRWPGMMARACRFEPTFHKYQGELCGGIQIHVTDVARFQPFASYLSMIQILRQHYPQQFQWRRPPYEYETERLPFDILCGTDRVRIALEAGEDPRAWSHRWGGELKAFAQQRRPFLLYN